jgi:hypothetical protein
MTRSRSRHQRPTEPDPAALWVAGGLGVAAVLCFLAGGAWVVLGCALGIWALFVAWGAGG